MLNQKSNQAIDNYYNGGDEFIWSTELVRLQRSRAARVLRSELGTLDGIAEKLNMETFEAKVLLVGLKMMGRIKLEIGGGWGYTYRVLDNSPLRLT